MTTVTQTKPRGTQLGVQAPGFAQSPSRTRRVLERTVERYRPPGLLADDPVRFVHRYSDPRDQEVVGLLAAALAYGRVRSIEGGVTQVLSHLGSSPANALLRGRHRRARWAEGFRYRWTSRDDLIGLVEACASTLRQEGGLGAALSARVHANGDFERGLADWIDALRERAATVAPLGRGLRFLLPDPGLGGACKRLRLYLRWMIRDGDGIDPGTWSGLVSAAGLTVPLDTHWIRIAPRLGLTRRKIPDGRMAREITAHLRRLAPEDPLRYDFPICHFGVQGGCPRDLAPEDCRSCPLRSVCHTARTMRVGSERRG